MTNKDYDLDDMMANIRTHVPDHDMATVIMGLTREGYQVRVGREMFKEYEPVFKSLGKNKINKIGLDIFGLAILGLIIGIVAPIAAAYYITWGEMKIFADGDLWVLVRVWSLIFGAMGLYLFPKLLDK